MIIGLLIAAAGSALFFPAAILLSYPFFLVALFIVGLGLAMLQIAANPYVTILGPERTAPSRLNLSQAANSFGTTIGPPIGGWLIFRVFNHPGAHGAEAAKVPYLCFAGVFVLLAVLFRFAHLPNFTNTETIGKGAGALRYPHTVLGMIAIFMYVGGEVTVGSVIVNFFGTTRLGGMSHEMASRYLSFYWGGLMIGRFMGALALSEIKRAKHALVIAVPVVAFVVIAPAVGVVGRRPLRTVSGRADPRLLYRRIQRTPDACAVRRDHRGLARDGDEQFWDGGPVDGARRGFVLFGDVVEHLLACHRGSGTAEKSGVVAVGDGDPWRRDPAPFAGIVRGQDRHPIFVRGADGGVCVRRVLRSVWVSRGTTPGFA